MSFLQPNVSTIAFAIVSSYTAFRRGGYLSAIDGLPGLLGHADLLATFFLETDARRRASFRIGNSHFGNVQRRFRTFDSTLRVRLGGLAMTSSDVNAFDNQFPVLRHHLDNIAGTPQIGRAHV